MFLSVCETCFSETGPTPAARAALPAAFFLPSARLCWRLLFLLAMELAQLWIACANDEKLVAFTDPPATLLYMLVPARGEEEVARRNVCWIGLFVEPCNVANAGRHEVLWPIEMDIC